MTWLRRGMALRRGGKFKSAIRALRRAEVIDPEDPKIVAELAAVLEALGDPDAIRYRRRARRFRR